MVCRMTGVSKVGKLGLITAWLESASLIFSLLYRIAFTVFHPLTYYSLQVVNRRITSLQPMHGRSLRNALPMVGAIRTTVWISATWVVCTLADKEHKVPPHTNYTYWKCQKWNTLQKRVGTYSL